MNHGVLGGRSRLVSILAALLVLVSGGAAAGGVGEDGPGETEPGVRVVTAAGAESWALEEPQPGDEVVIVGRIGVYGNEPFAAAAIDTFLDPEGARERRRYQFAEDGVVPADLSDPAPPGLVRVRGVIERIPTPGRSGIVRADSIDTITE